MRELSVSCGVIHDFCHHALNGCVCIHRMAKRVCFATKGGSSLLEVHDERIR
jgi:hypothetical protein